MKELTLEEFDANLRDLLPSEESFRSLSILTAIKVNDDIEIPSFDGEYSSLLFWNLGGMNVDDDLLENVT